MSIPHWSSHFAAIARKHGSWAQGIEARVMAEAIATEIEAGPPPGLSAGRGGGGAGGPQQPAGGQLPEVQSSRVEDNK